MLSATQMIITKIFTLEICQHKHFSQNIILGVVTATSKIFLMYLYKTVHKNVPLITLTCGGKGDLIPIEADMLKMILSSISLHFTSTPQTAYTKSN